jgi:hypothetical protein
MPAHIQRRNRCPTPPSIEIDLRGTRFWNLRFDDYLSRAKAVVPVLDERKMSRGDTGRVIVEFRRNMMGTSAS